MLGQVRCAPALAGDPVVQLTYRSRARGDLTAADIEGLLRHARRRNRRLGVTGMLLFDRHAFLQVLEGPAAAVEAIWSDIQRDPRHREVELLAVRRVALRGFARWDMQYFGGRSLRARAALGGGEPGRLGEAVRDTVRLALADDAAALGQRLAGLAAAGLSHAVLIAGVVEPAARALGDAWLRDDCTDLDLTIALGALQRASHAVQGAAWPAPGAPGAQPHAILLATAPGEPHVTGLSFLCDLFGEAGWDVHLAFPASAAELAADLEQFHPDALDISLSEAMPRRHAIQTLRETVCACRNAWPDGQLVVSVGGRLFVEGLADAASVGADHARASAAEAVARIGGLVDARSRQGQGARHLLTH